MRKMKGKVILNNKGKKMSFPEKERICTASRLGCPQPGCKEHICEACWAEGYDKHKKPKRKRG